MEESEITHLEQFHLFQQFFLNPFPNNKFQTPPNLRDFADDNFKFDQNRRKFSKRVENTGGMGKIVCYEQFLVFPQCFQKTCSADM